MAGILSTNQRLAFGEKSLEYHGILIRPEDNLGEFTVPIWKWCDEWLGRQWLETYRPIRGQYLAENCWSMTVLWVSLRVTEVTSQFQYRGNALSDCDDNGRKPIDKSEAIIWWKISGEWWYANQSCRTWWRVNCSNMEAIWCMVADIMVRNEVWQMNACINWCTVRRTEGISIVPTRAFWPKTKRLVPTSIYSRQVVFTTVESVLQRICIHHHQPWRTVSYFLRRWLWRGEGPLQ